VTDTAALNQSPPWRDVDEFSTNVALVEGVERHDAGWAGDRLRAAGALVGSAPFQDWAEAANANPPVLRTHDRDGNRIDEVRYHPAYHEILGRALSAGAHSWAWREPRPGAHVARAACFMLFAQVEPGHACPVSMTHSVVPALRVQPEAAERWEVPATALDYDPRLAPVGEKRTAIFGMAMTERQGGSDVRANTTRARPVDGGGPAGEYRLDGHKWFCSAPMSDAFLVLAQDDGGPSCFLVPRVLPDGDRNPFVIDRLKDKLGNRANASAEIRLEDTRGWMVGQPGRGVPTIIEMVNHTRLDCVLGTAAGMRQCVAEAGWYVSHRRAFGALLVDQPIMTNVLADLCLESEAATALGLRLARAYDEDTGEREHAFRRLATAVGKYWVCKRGPQHAAEAVECLGGNGYCETFPLARRYREQPVMSIWEGSGNVMCLDVLRAARRQAGTLDAFLTEVELARGADRILDGRLADLRRDLGAGDVDPVAARRLVEAMALALQASLLVRFAPPVVADAFTASRLGPERGAQFGTLPSWAGRRAIVERHLPIDA
jgi:putative acyl-CoA dehydrogenase